MPYLKTICAGPLETNAYLIGVEGGDVAILIDAPPDSYEAIMDALTADGRELAAILVTHPHIDHILDISRFSKSGIDIFALSEAVEGILHPDSLGLFPLPPGGFPGAVVNSVIRGGDVVELAGLSFEVLEVPGHSQGSAAFAVSKEGLCFVGDAIFKGSIGRTDIQGGNFDVLAESIQNCIYTLPEHTVLLPGHGPPTEVGKEKRSNPYVRG